MLRYRDYENPYPYYKNPPNNRTGIAEDGPDPDQNFIDESNVFEEWTW